MANLKRKIELLADIVVGNLLKCRINYDLYVRKRISISTQVEPTVMVSLTSYGHRLRHSVQYTLYSMLKQKVRPAKIVLWTDAGAFTNEPIPQALQVLQKYGVEIKEYPPKIRSFKKLIPSLKEEDTHLLASKYDFSGGQIENIARHYTIGKILHGESENVIEAISAYCDSERLETKEKRKIGF